MQLLAAFFADKENMARCNGPFFPDKDYLLQHGPAIGPIFCR